MGSSCYDHLYVMFNIKYKELNIKNWMSDKIE